MQGLLPRLGVYARVKSHKPSEVLFVVSWGFRPFKLKEICGALVLDVFEKLLLYLKFGNSKVFL